MTGTTPTVTRAQVIAYRWRAHQLDRAPNAGVSAIDAALLDLGVQDTGTGGTPWALEIRGTPSAGADDLALAWTIRGAPHAYRRVDLPLVAHATAPLSEDDAGKRIFDANKPLKAAGIAALEALTMVAGLERSIVSEPTAKGELSTRLTEVLDAPYLRECRPCKTTHLYEMPFRLAALQAGLELEANTSPPVLRRAPAMTPPLVGALGGSAEPRLQVIRSYLRFFGPARQRDVATFADAPLKTVKQHWPEDAVAVAVPELDGPSPRTPRYVLAGDLESLTADPAEAASPSDVVRLAGPYDAYLQLRDRETLVADDARRKDLWRILGRPGALLAGGEVVGTWRPRKAGNKLTLAIQRWAPFDRRLDAAVTEQAERYATFRGVHLTGVTAD